MWTQFLFEDHMKAMTLDALKASHPIAQSVGDPAEIGQLFDAISYSKGASIIQMLETYLNFLDNGKLDSFPVSKNFEVTFTFPDLFRQGLQDYLNIHKFGNAETVDLWAALTEAAKKANHTVDVQDLMESWTTQTGYVICCAMLYFSNRCIQFSIFEV
jgi:aminopeptidase N